MNEIYFELPSPDAPGLTRRVSDLVRGNIDRFSIDMLVKLLAKTGRGVEIRVKRRST